MNQFLMYLLCNQMHIPNLDSLPEAGTRATWARLLEINPTTLWRAERKADLKGQRAANGSVIYTKRSILEWLGFTFEPPKPLKRPF